LPDCKASIEHKRSIRHKDNIQKSEKHLVSIRVKCRRWKWLCSVVIPLPIVNRWRSGGYWVSGSDYCCCMRERERDQYWCHRYPVRMYCLSMTYWLDGIAASTHRQLFAEEGRIVPKSGHVNRRSETSWLESMCCW
jgi:hypothetical protein